MHAVHSAILKEKCGGADGNIDMNPKRDLTKLHLARKHCANISDVPTTKLPSLKLLIYPNHGYHRKLEDMGGNLSTANSNSCGFRGY